MSIFHDVAQKKVVNCAECGHSVIKREAKEVIVTRLGALQEEISSVLYYAREHAPKYDRLYRTSTESIVYEYIKQRDDFGNTYYKKIADVITKYDKDTGEKRDIRITYETIKTPVI